MFRIAVADHQPVMLMFYRKMLPRMGCQLVAVLESEREVLVECHRLLPDLLILDAGFPAGGPKEFADRICRSCHVPVIILTAERLQDDRDQEVKDSGVKYLTKPVGAATLELEIPLAIRRFKQQESLSTKTSESNPDRTVR